MLFNQRGANLSFIFFGELSPLNEIGIERHFTKPAWGALV